MKEYPHLIEKDNMMSFLSDTYGNFYNLCHCERFLSASARRPDCDDSDWSNFEIADMDFWRSDAYTEFFNFLDRKGGFYYEVRFPLAIRLGEPEN
jgi:alpha 1,2-mannosyltransferase